MHLSGNSTGDFNDAATLGATLVDTIACPGTPVSGATINFSLGSQQGSATTDSAGHASLGVTPNVAAGSYPLAASFAGTAQYLSSTASDTFTVGKEETNLTITSSNTLAAGSVAITAVLQEDGAVPLAGRTIRFQFGNTTVSATTDSSGKAAVTLTLGSGAYDVKASFDGDAYERASDTGAAQVTGGDYAANASFKGYAAQVTASAWTTGPGNSSTPPDTVPGYMGVLVATHIAKNGSTISGNTAEVVVLRVDNPASYQPNPGHQGSGVLQAVVSSGGSTPPAATVTSTATLPVIATATATSCPTNTPTSTPTNTSMSTPTATPTNTAVPTATPTNTAVPTATSTFTPTPTPAPSLPT